MDFIESFAKSVEAIRKGEYKEPEPKGTDYSFRYDDIFNGRIKWELSCALITRDWGRVRNALVMIDEKPTLIRRGRSKNGKKEGDSGIPD